MRQPFSDNVNYRSAIRSLLHLHRLWGEGKGESPEANLIRDEMDGPWRLLSETERKRIWGLSQDLNSIEQPPTSLSQAEIDPQAQTKLLDAYEARQRGEWDRALDQLRTLEKTSPPALLSHLRGSIWLDAGDAEVANVFIEHAARIEPDSSSYHLLCMNTAVTPEQPFSANVT